MEDYNVMEEVLTELLPLIPNVSFSQLTGASKVECSIGEHTGYGKDAREALRECLNKTFFAKQKKVKELEETCALYKRLSYKLQT